jgi:dihydrofolate reductase
MRPIIVSTFLSLDGVMQAPGAPDEDTSGGFPLGGWSFNHWDETMGQVMAENFATPFDLLLGRRTYDIFASHWPKVDDETGRAFTACQKYVATHRPLASDWANSHRLGADTVASVRALKAGQGPALSVQGSQNFLQTLIAHDLVDEYRLMIFPVILGTGRKLFATGSAPVGLKLTKSHTSTTGVVTAWYDRDEMKPMGSFALPE